MAETKVGGAFVDLHVKDKRFQGGMNKAGSRLASFARNAAIKGRAIGNAIALPLLGAAVLVGRAIAKQEDAEAKLEAVIKATGGAAGFTAGQLKKQASALQNLTRFGDEAVIELQAILATFRNIKGDEFKQVTSLALDMAVVLGTDTKSAAIQLGKALNDPITGLTALTRSGITFNDVQKKQIRGFQESGQMAKAQGVILKELKNQFEGVAEASAGTVGGRFTQMLNSLGDTLERLGAIAAGGDDGGLADVFLKARIQVDLLNESLENLGGGGGGGGFLSGVKKRVEQTAAFFGALSAGDSISGALDNALTVPQQLEAERKKRFDDVKARQKKAEALTGERLSPEIDNAAGAGAAASRKPSFKSFESAIKGTQSLQDKTAKESLNIQKKQLKKQEELLEWLQSNPFNEAEPIVTR